MVGIRFFAAARAPSASRVCGAARAIAAACRAPLFALLFAFLFPLLVAGCSHVNPYYDPAKPHHTPSGFRNNSGIDEQKSLWEVAAWLLFGERPRAPAGGWVIPTTRTDLARLRAPDARGQVTWIGHSTLLVQIDGLNFLTDPHLTARASPFDWAGPKRHVPPAVAIPDLPRIDVVFVSHSHYDHLDLRTLGALARQPGGPPVYVVPLGLKALLADAGITTAVELDWWDTHRVGTATIHLVPAQHWSARTRLDKNRTLWGGVVLEAGGRRFVYTGDTGYSGDFREIGRRFGGFDLAAIPIGAYAPRSFMRAQHVDPAEAVQIFADLGARHAVGVHWGTFTLGDEPLDEPPSKLAAARTAAGIAESAFFTLKIGETRSFDALGRAAAP